MSSPRCVKSMAATPDTNEPGWVAEARRLKAAGHSVREIAETVGKARSTVQDYLTGFDHRRAVERARAPLCPACGEPFAQAQGGRPYERCGPCRSRDRHERALQIERWWAEGRSMAAICSNLGWAKGTLACEIWRMREDGYNVPLRHHGSYAEARKAAAA